ncbi:lysoplasmalogenase family protein [Mesorhizobium sp.]|uniref:lysoplasmalogenase family protein n=1 Tax=Mesorhizobium sp. TaxID=1871066 RepID=UPI000FE7E4D3|nr:lysoplasmalogenase family protein [Mesorhizobium sp.]RWP61085.1 MAG: lysoplasmalogenase [Mesorhizobium sp.]
MPFSGGIDADANATLLFSLAAAVIYAFTIDMPPKLARSAVKTLAVAMLAVLASLQGGPWLLIAALALSAIGDALLSRDGEKAFVGGLASFLVAHGFYIALFLRFGDGVGLFLAEPWRAAIAGAMAVLALAMLLALWRRVGPALRLPISVYIATIFAMSISALTLSNLWVVGGAVLFMASDGLLASEKFLLSAISPHRHWTRHAVWMLYYAAQLGITMGFPLG